jgi:tetratricopeptide (TPR) repeat protein
MILSIVLLLCVPAQSQAYLELRDEGRLAEALDSIEAMIGEDLDDEMTHTVRNYAGLLFETGQIDRAIEVAEPLAQSFRALGDRARLAEYYRYSGRKASFDRILEQSLRVSRMMMQYGLDAENWIAAGKLQELDGTDPSRVLAHYRRLLESRPDNVDGLNAAGSIALRTKSYDVAARYFLRALEVEDSSQPALSGLARAFHRAYDPRLEDIIAELLEINPHHPTRFEIEAEKHLDTGDTEKAHQALDQILEINTNHIRALSLKAAAYYLADNHDAVSDTQQRILSINASASSAYRIPGRVASRHYRFAQGKSFQLKALQIDPTDTAARLYLAFDQLRLGEDDDARPQLEHVFESDPYNVQAYNLLGVSDALAEFETIKDPTFHLQMPADEAVVLSTPVRSLLREAAERYQKKYAITLETPVRVQIFNNHDEFIVRSVGLPGSAGHLGICFGKLITMDSPTARPPGAINWRQVLWHEFVHVITLQKTHNRMPRWLSEGISVYEEMHRDSSWGIKLDPQYKEIVDVSGWPTTDELERYFTRPESETELMFGYFAAGEFVQAYVDAWGFPSLVKTLDLIAQSHRAVEALALAASVSSDDLNTVFEKHLRARCAPFEHVSGSPKSEPYRLAKTVTDLIRTGDRHAKAGAYQEAEAAYQTAHDHYPDFLGKTAPLRRIADMWEATDSVSATIKALENVIAWDSKSFDASLKLAELSADSETRNRAFERAFSINPFDVALLDARYRHLKSINDPASLEAIERLIHVDSARRQSHRLSQAELLVSRGDTVSAKTALLTLLEETPNDWLAQRLLLKVAGEVGP